MPRRRHNPKFRAWSSAAALVALRGPDPWRKIPDDLEAELVDLVDRFPDRCAGYDAVAARCRLGSVEWLRRYADDALAEADRLAASAAGEDVSPFPVRRKRLRCSSTDPTVVARWIDEERQRIERWREEVCGAEVEAVTEG